MSASSATHGAHGTDAGHGGHDHGHDHGDEASHIKHYNKIYWTLIVLFLVSVAGPMVGDLLHNKVIVLITAFGIALVKAYLVCAHFMHLNVEKKYIIYLLSTALAFMFLFYAGVAPDVMEHHGRNWENVAAKQEVERALNQQAAEHANPTAH